MIADSITTDNAIATHIPFVPILNDTDNIYANGNLTTTLAIIEEIIGGKVSPAPWKTPP